MANLKYKGAKFNFAKGTDALEAWFNEGWDVYFSEVLNGELIIIFAKDEGSHERTNSTG